MEAVDGSLPKCDESDIEILINPQEQEYQDEYDYETYGNMGCPVS